MFGKNEVVGQKYFKDFPSDTLLVTSRFLTLQGEGPYRGQPAFFVRLAKCNLSCSFCDTYFDSGEPFTYQEIFDQYVQIMREKWGPVWPEYVSDGQIVLVLTGGEPMLQKNIGQFLEMASGFFNSTQIESNGILLQDIPASTTLVISPKCLEKDGKAIRYIKPNPDSLARADCLKFVMTADQDSPYSDIPDWAHEWSREFGREVFVSPMNIYLRAPKQAKIDETNNSGISQRSEVDETISFWEEGLLDREVNQKNHEYVAQYCINHGFTLNLQQHLYASLP